MELYFATNRNYLTKKKGYGTDFNKASPKEFRVGTVKMKKVKKAWKVDRIDTAKESSRAVKGTRGPVKEWTVKGTDAIFKSISKTAMAGDATDIFVFLHGAAYSFEDAAEDLADLTELYAEDTKKMIPFLFSYPTNGHSDPVNYFADRDDASLSGPAMARAFGRFIDLIARLTEENRCRCRVHLLAHSLGNYATRIAVEAIFGNVAYRRIRLFSNVILAAADDDVDTLANADKMMPLTRLADQIVVYYDPTDKLLRLSDAVHMDRLGQKGPQPWPGRVVNNCKITVVDCQRAAFDIDDDSQRHRHIKYSSAVIKDIKAVLQDKPGADFKWRKQEKDEDRPGWFAL